jgi:hypothetical protein
MRTTYELLAIGRPHFRGVLLNLGSEVDERRDDCHGADDFTNTGPLREIQFPHDNS